MKMTSLSLAGALLAGLPFSALAKTQPQAKPALLQYVALGDSLAAGQTPTGYIDYGNADYIANQFVAGRFQLNDFDLSNQSQRKTDYRCIIVLSLYTYKELSKSGFLWGQTPCHR
ncbi:hypothetical protein [Bacillus sp. M6-12]|uniref:hypothetical protein n=1 Tax=Bacillus sp. M6-12 TaxID=2054166 RepID=UPI002155A91A|nr:hypothetical protein [Bacillus sp. M6-12]